MNGEILAKKTTDDNEHTTVNCYVMEGAALRKELDIYHLILSPTNACNLRCKHCYLPDHTNRLLSEDVVMSLANQWNELVLRERGEFGGIFHLKGGEPFVVPYLPRLIDRLIELQAMQLMLTTNGMFSDTESLALMRHANDGLNGQMTVIVSLDGSTPSTHEALRGEGTFQKVIGFVEKLVGIGINTHLNCVLRQENLDEVASYIRLARKIGAAQVNFLPLVPKGFGQSLQCHRPDHSQTHDVVHSAFLDGDDATKRMLAGSLSHILERERKGVCASCECVAAYRGLLYVTPNGSAYSCPNLLGEKHLLGNVTNDTVDSLMARLPGLYSTLRSDGKNDSFVCAGERRYYEETNNSDALLSLDNLQVALQAVHSTRQHSELVSYCVSRNF